MRNLDTKINSNKNTGGILLKDALFVTVFVYLILCWFEWRSPGSVSLFFDRHYLLLLIILSGFFLLDLKVNLFQAAKVIFSFSVIFLALNQAILLTGTAIDQGTLSNALEFFDVSIKKVKLYSLFLLFISGIFIIWKSKNNINKLLDFKQKNEVTLEDKRKDHLDGNSGLICLNFSSRSKIALSILKLPFYFIQYLLFNLFRWIYINGYKNFLLLFAILAIFTLIKAPFMDLSFAGRHPMKYNTYVEPALYMVENDNLFWYQKKYTGNPIGNPQGIKPKFGHLPLMEWSLAGIYKLFPKNSTEINTRILMHIIGVLSLIFSYILFKKWLTKKIALLITFLLAINPIFLSSTYCTVYDSWLLMFTFISLIFLTNYLSRKRLSSLYFSGIFFGIGASCKYSIFLWLAPIILVLLWWKSKDSKLYFLFDYLLIILIVAMSVFATETAINKLPSNFFFGISLLAFWAVLLIIVYITASKIRPRIEILLHHLRKNKKTALISTFAALIISIFFITSSNIPHYSSEFLTDSKLIFNTDLYNFMLVNQFKQNVTEYLFYFGLMGLAITFLIQKKIKLLVFSFATGVLIYWVLASKAIFFHGYYELIIVLAILIPAAISIYVFLMFYRRKNKLFLVCLSFLLLLSPITYGIELLSLQKSGTSEATKYLYENTKSDEAYIYEGPSITFTINTKRALYSVAHLDIESIRRNIQNIGFSDTMNKHNIKYLITTNKEPDYLKLINLFSPDKLEQSSYRRTDKIFSKIYEDYDYFSDILKRGMLIDELKLEKRFTLEKEIGDYKFYTFNN